MPRSWGLVFDYQIAIYLSPHFLTLHFAGIARELGSEVLSRG